jgi:hypothetical protein
VPKGRLFIPGATASSMTITIDSKGTRGLTLPHFVCSALLIGPFLSSLYVPLLFLFFFLLHFCRLLPVLSGFFGVDLVGLNLFREAHLPRAE